MDNRDYEILLSAFDKAEVGPVVGEREWDLEYITKAVRKFVEQYDVSWEAVGHMVPDDDELADRVFQAGFEYAREIGLYCLESKRQMLWSQDELDEILSRAPTEVVLGTGDEVVTVYKRNPEDDTRIVIGGGAWATPVPEELYRPIFEAYAKEPLFDFVDSPTQLTTHGREIRAGSPWEAVAAWQEATMEIEVVKQLGRPGICISCVENSPTEIGELAATTFGAFRPSDLHHVSFVSEHKTSYSLLTKAVHFAHTKSVSEAFANPIYGGYVGGKEGVAIAIVAGTILLRACYGSHLLNTGPTHALLSASTYPDLISATALAFQALSRNTNLLFSPFVRPAAGPGTKDILYECAALTIASTTSGASYIDAVQSATGINIAHVSPIEARFCVQVAHAAEGLRRKDANAIVNELVERYKDGQKERRIGKSFTEVYDLETLEPTPAWQQMYEEVCEEMESEFGLSLAT